MAERESTRELRISLLLELPSDRSSVALARHLVSAAMQELGVWDEHRADVELALSEACTNAVRHAVPPGPYRVSISIDRSACDLTVADRGCGAASRDASTVAQLGAERGRGLALMDKLMDTMELTSGLGDGTVVHLVKLLRFDESAPARRLVLETVRTGRR